MSARILCALVYFVGLLSNVYAQVPNDDPCNAIALAVGINCNFATFSNAGANASIGVPAPGCANYLGGDVWFSVTVPANGSLSFDSNTGVISDGGMAIYSGTCNALNLIECDDDDSPNGLMPSISQTGLIPGATIWIRMWEYGNDNNGTFDICVYSPAPPPVLSNDDPCDAIILPVGTTCNFATFSNAGANASIGVPAPGCANYLGGDVWFSVTVPASGALTFDSNTGVISDGGMAVYSGTCNALNLIECNDDFFGLMPSISQTGLIPGATIWIRMWEYGNNNNGTFDICVYDQSAPPAPPCTTPICSAPIPDDCNTACALGTLSAPPPCPATTVVNDNFCLSNIGASAENPYNYLSDCQGIIGNDMSAPAADTWYSFTATSSAATFTVTGLNTPNIALYQGTNCANSFGLGCNIGFAGSVSLTYNSLSVGQSYLVRISGGDSTDIGNFNLGISSYNNCDDCLINSSLVVNPTPLNGLYLAGQTVEFCYTVESWDQTGVNWLHSVVPFLGPGWDLSSLAPTVTPPSCDLNGQWGWYNAVTSSNTGLIFGPGFFYDSSAGDTDFPANYPDNNPGDNFGDNCAGPWTFCWEITVGNCPPNVNGENLNVSIETFGDSETGSWTTLGCATDPVYEFFSTASCCPAPQLNNSNPICVGGNDGEIYAETTGSPPFTFIYESPLGNVIQSNTHNQTADTLTGLNAGWYFVTIQDNGGCSGIDSIELIDPAALNGILDTTICQNFAFNFNGTLYNALNTTGVELLTSVSGCDSSVTVTVNISPLDSTFSTSASCNPIDTGIVSVTNPNQFGCDSVHTVTTTFLQSDLTFDLLSSCNPLDTGIVSVTNPNQFGCDSVHTIVTSLLPSDSTFANATSCNPIDTGQASVTNPNQFGCDSVHTIVTSLLPSDSTFANATSCNPLDTGIVSVTNPNQFGCDSVHTSATAFLATPVTNLGVIACDSTIINGINFTINTIYNDTIFGGAANSCDSIVVYSIIINSSDSTFTVGTSCNPLDTGVVSVTNPNQLGCDSVHTVTTTFLQSDLTFDLLSSCNPLDTGIVSVTNPNQFGCDSVHTITTTFLQSDSTFDLLSSCNPLDTGIVNLTNTNQFGCDSVHTIVTSLLPSDSTFANATSCNPLDTGIVSVMNPNQFGCDSVHTIATAFLATPVTNLGVIACDSTIINGINFTINTIYNDTIFGGAANACDSIVVYSIIINSSDSTFTVGTSCNPLDTGVVSVTNPNQFGCDSVHTITTALLPSNSTFVNLNSCNPLDTGIVSVTNPNQFGCDSVHTITTTFLQSDSTFDLLSSCNPLDTGIVNLTNTNQFGCDSVHTIVTTLLPSDSTFANATSCNPLDTGIVSVTNPNQFGCDSVHTIATTLLPSDSTFANATSCNPLDTGVISVTNPNQFGCDSVHTTATTLLPSDATFANASSCNPLDTGVVSVTNPNQFGCDSVHTIITTLLPSNSTFVSLNSCNPADTGIVSVTNLNQFGCDSTHIIATILLPSSSSLTQLNACDSITWIDGNTYTSNTSLVDTLIAANGCDSVATIQISIAQSSANPIQILLCPNELPYLLDNGVLIDGSQGTIVDSLSNTFGCDSVITYDITYAPDYYISPDMLLASLGDSVSFAINNPSTDVLVSYTSDNGENCESPCNDYLLYPTEAVNNYYFSLIDTVTECTYSDILTIEINLYSELNVPNIFTPNGDGSNETFRCFGKNIDQYQLSVFDRWGGKMFETNLLDEGWDGLFLGQAIENGIYIAIIQATGLDGQKYTITQNIKLVR